MKTERKMDLPEIKDLAKKFVDFTLGSEKPKGFCLTISRPLSLFLLLNKIHNSISLTEVEDEQGLQCHFWVTLESDIIIDSTITQFKQYEDFENPFTGKKPKHYFEEKYNTEEDNNVFEEYYKSSVSSFHNPTLRNNQLTERELNNQAKVIFKAAYLVNNEMEKMPLKDDSELKQLLGNYFNYVTEIFKLRFENNKEFFKSELPEYVIDFLLN